MLSRRVQPNAQANGRQSRRSSSTLTSVPRRQLQQSTTPGADDNDNDSAPPRKRQRQGHSDSEGDDEDESFQGCVLL